jgi:hypothetical protein
LLLKQTYTIRARDNEGEQGDVGAGEEVKVGAFGLVKSQYKTMIVFTEDSFR